MKLFLSIFFIFALSLFAIRYFAVPGFFPIHDDAQVSRVYEMAQSLKDGMFPVRWVKDLGYGYGYPIFNFYAPLAYYFGAILTLVGLDPLVVTKITFGTGIILAGVFMYLLGRSMWGSLGGLISSILYVYAPYSALNIYVRGDLAEVWGYAFVPLFFFGLVNLFKTSQIKYVFIGSIGLAGVILSHNLTAYMTSLFFIPSIIIFTFFSKNRLRFFLYSIASFGLGLLLSAFYFIPAFFEMQFTNVFSQVGGGADFRDHFVCIQQLWESNWGFGGSAKGCVDGMSFRIGKLHLVLALASLLALILKDLKLEKKLILFLLASALTSILLMLPVSKIKWEIVPLMEFLQYPWRFLIFASFFTSLLGGASIYLTRLLPEKIFRHAGLEYAVLISLFAVLFYSKLFLPQTILPKMSTDYTEKSILNYKISRISDEYMPKNFDKPQSLEEVPQSLFTIDDREIKITQNKTQEIIANANLSSESLVHANIAYFPAWEILVNGEKTDINIKENGFDFKIPKGEAEIKITFSQTPIEKLSNRLSLIGFVALFIGIIRRRKI